MPLVIPDDVLSSTGFNEREMQIEIACWLFDAGKLGLWPAARLAAMARGEFEEELASRKIAIYRPTLEDWEVDKKTIEELERRTCPSS